MMSKSELIQKIADDLSLSKKDVKAVIESLATVGYKEMKKGGEFLLPGFAKFVVIRSRLPKRARASIRSRKSQRSSRRSRRERRSRFVR